MGEPTDAMTIVMRPRIAHGISFLVANIKRWPLLCIFDEDSETSIFVRLQEVLKPVQGGGFCSH